MLAKYDVEAKYLVSIYALATATTGISDQTAHREDAPPGGKNCVAGILCRMFNHI